MTQPLVIARLQQIFDDVFLEPVKVTPELSARDVQEWDSLTHISLLVVIEKTFHIKFRVGEVEATDNIGQLADLIVRRMIEN